MHTHLFKDPMPYHGPELSSHWIYRQTGLQGDAIVAFAGPCEVHLQDMVDLEDVQMQAPIYSEMMLHFLIEHFQVPLPEMVLRQRLFVSQLQSLLHQEKQPQVQRQGDDLMDGNDKISVSIATVSPVSGLIHCGLNISSQNTPVPTKGLADYQIEWQTFAKHALSAYKNETASIWLACTKVRAVT